MSDVELQPGWWFAGGCQIADVRGYHAKHLSHLIAKSRPAGVDPPPPAPRHLEWDPQRVARPLTPAQRCVQRQRTAEWLSQFSAWIGRTPTLKAPAPPRRGSVVVWQLATTGLFYAVGERARDALALLRRVAVASGGGRTDKLLWCAEEYARLRRRGRGSIGEMSRDQLPLIQARAALENALSDLAAATAAGDDAARARAESGRAEARARLARAERQMKQAPQMGASALAAFCLEVAERKPVQECVADFVAAFGPLILDFGAWCVDAEYGAFVSRHPASALDLSSSLLQLGYERFMWPTQWRKWATTCYERATCVLPVRPVAAPVAFYVWAAHMLTALREHPEWPGCQLFLANRLASLRLVADATWFPELAARLRPRQGRRLAARLYGELLDYLALAAARWGPASATHPSVVPCENCGVSFVTTDGRRSYCDACSNRKTRNRVGQRRYRSQHPR